MPTRTPSERLADRGLVPLRVLVVDDHQTFADLLVLALEDEIDIECVGAANTAAAALDLAVRTNPDVVIMDIQLGKESGLVATRRIHEQAPETVIVVVTAHSDPSWLAKAAQAGASAFVPKSGSLKEMLSAIREARHGAMLVSPSLFQVGDGQPADHQPSRRNDPVGTLTARERDVLKLMGQGASAPEIARELNISVNTCRGYVKAVHAKLGVRSQLEAVVKAHRLGLIAVADER